MSRQPPQTAASERTQPAQPVDDRRTTSDDRRTTSGDRQTTSDDRRTEITEHPQPGTEADPTTAVSAELSPPGDAPFAVCLTHDVDRPFKTYQAIPEAVRQRSLNPLASVASNPYWQFDTIRELERELGVRSSFYFLQEPPVWRMGGPRAWLQPTNWIEHCGRYDPTREPIAAVVRRLDEGGWEVGLHASRRAARDPERLETEKRRLEAVLGHRVAGCRVHHLAVRPATWRAQRRLGFAYDASVGSSETYGVGPEPFVPVPGVAVVPLTAMEVTLPDPGESFQSAKDACRRLCRRAARESAVLTVLWHPRYFASEEFPGYRRLYRWFVDHALSRGAWVGSIGELCRATQADPDPVFDRLGPD